MDSAIKRACVIGSGPNGLAAAIVLAQAGMRVDLFEAEAEPGGAVRTLPLTLPGFRHDFGSAVYPFAAGSPFFSKLPLANHGLEWIHGEAPLAHPLDDGSAVVLERNLEQAERALGADGKIWRGLMQPAADDWMEFEAVLEKANAKRVFVVAIVGHGRKHDATLTAYQQAARKNAAQDKFGKVHVEVVSFDAVTDPDEIALDLITLVS